MSDMYAQANLWLPFFPWIDPICHHFERLEKVWVVCRDVKQQQEYSQRQNSLPRVSSFNSTIDLFGFPFHLGDNARSDKKKITQPSKKDKEKKVNSIKFN